MSGLITRICACMWLSIDSFQGKTRGRFINIFFKIAIQLLDLWFSTLTVPKGLGTPSHLVRHPLLTPQYGNYSTVTIPSSWSSATDCEPLSYIQIIWASTDPSLSHIQKWGVYPSQTLWLSLHSSL